MKSVLITLVMLISVGGTFKDDSLSHKESGFKLGFREGVKYGRELCVDRKSIYNPHRRDSLLKLNLYEN